MQTTARPRSAEETKLIATILREFGAIHGLRIARFNTGAARRRSGALVKFGVPGQADIMGIVAPHGRLVCLEAKSRTGVQSEKQRRFQRMIEVHGGAYAVVRSVEDARAALVNAGVSL